MTDVLSPEEKKVLETLDSLGIRWERFEHPPVFTLEESSRYWKDRGGAHCKNLFIRNYRGNRHYLVIIRGDKKVDLKQLNLSLAEDRLSFASAERLQRFLGLTAGAVSPFGLINDRQKEVRVVVDRDLLVETELNFHPNVNTATVKIFREDFLKFLEWSGQKVIYLEIKTSTE
ncbi:MAG: prolyl-tRNA synthetase associated domain-containing protein [Candidatus Saccharicenans sp.]|nr:prolyl-tRNA synthetase associated domain-containing protein [Candidatus Saccharicenans sp.]MDI6848497.1 prolyl-tRNA synthetase associated domain-containing protein [Candidatus Saccharicenans sp.]